MVMAAPRDWRALGRLSARPIARTASGRSRRSWSRSRRQAPCSPGRALRRTGRSRTTWSCSIRPEVLDGANSRWSGPAQPAREGPCPGRALRRRVAGRVLREPGADFDRPGRGAVRERTRGSSHCGLYGSRVFGWPGRRRTGAVTKRVVQGWDVQVEHQVLVRYCRAPGCRTALMRKQRTRCELHRESPGSRRAA
jgi:hypothetical protein